MTGVHLSKRCAVAAEDIRHLQGRSHDARSDGRYDLQAEPIKWTRRVADRFGGDPGVARRARRWVRADAHRHGRETAIASVERAANRCVKSSGAAERA